MLVCTLSHRFCNLPNIGLSPMHYSTQDPSVLGWTGSREAKISWPTTENEKIQIVLPNLNPNQRFYGFPSSKTSQVLQRDQGVRSHNRTEWKERRKKGITWVYTEVTSREDDQTICIDQPCVNLKICDEKHLYMVWLKTLGGILHNRDKPAMCVVYQGASIHQRLLVSSEVARSVRNPFLLTREKKDVSNPATFTQGHFGLFLISFVILFQQASTAISRFSAKDYNDHMALVHAYEGWKEAEREGSAYEYCWRNFLFAQTLQAIHSIRNHATT
ncbi:hypothetical protein Lser_V15G30977 [Lactuca serriola]